MPDPVASSGFLAVPVSRRQVLTPALTSGLCANARGLGRVAGVEWVPCDKELGLNADGKFLPAYLFGRPTPYSSAEGYPLTPGVIPWTVLPDAAIARAFPAGDAPYVTFEDSKHTPFNVTIMPPQLLFATVLDTDLDPATNPGLLVASPSLYRYPGRLGHGDTGYAPNHPTYSWTGSFAWDASAETFSISSQQGHPILYSLDGSAPSITYSTPVALAGTTTVRFRFAPVDKVKGPIFAATVTYTSGEPEASFSRGFPTIQYDDWDDTGTSMPPSGWEDDCGVAYRWTYGTTTPADPTPQTKSAAAVGTRITERFLPSTLANGTLKVIAYRYGWQLSPVASFAITVRIGKLSAAWSKINEQLTLSTPTSGATIKYSLDGSDPSLTYSGPLAITDTTTVRFIAEKTGMGSSDSHSLTLTYADDTPPEDFSADYLTAISDPEVARTVPLCVSLMPEPDFFCSPDGTGDGLTPESPAALVDIIGKCYLDFTYGTQVVSEFAKTIGGVKFTATYTHSTDQLVLSFPRYGGTNYPDAFYGVDAAPGTVIPYDPLTLSGSTTVNFAVKKSDQSYQYTPTWSFVRVTGTTVLTFAWDKDAQTVTISGAPVGVRLLCDDGATPVSEIFGAATLTTAATLRVRMASSCGATDTVAATYIDPNVTDSFSETLTLTWTNANATVIYEKPAEVVWVSAGEYASTEHGKYIGVRALASNSYAAYPRFGPMLFGGFNSDFTVRDRAANQTVIKSSPCLAPTYVTGRGLYSDSVVDGFTFNFATVEASRTNLYLTGGVGIFQHCIFDVLLRGGQNTVTIGGSPRGWFGSGICVHHCALQVVNDSPVSGGSVSISAVDVRNWVDSTLDISTVSPTSVFLPCRISRCAVAFSIAVPATSSGSSGVSLWTNEVHDSSLGADINLGSATGYPSVYTGLNSALSGYPASVSLVNSAITYDAVLGSSDGWSVDSLLEIFSAIDSSITCNAECGNSSPTVSQFSRARLSTRHLIDCQINADLAVGSGVNTEYTYGGWVEVSYPDVGTMSEIGTVTEDIPSGARVNGNQQRRTSQGAGSYGWYGNANNGAGAPLTGVETAQGTGTQYGRYWE